MASAASVVLFSFKAAIPEPPAPPAPPPPSNPATYRQQPPFIERVWIKQLATPLGTGENMLLKVKFFDVFDPPSTLDVYDGTGGQITFYDDGTNGDVTVDDNIYSTYVYDNATEFVDRLETIETDLASDGSFLHFDGHVGSVVEDMPVFDEISFANKDEVMLDLHFFEKPGRCLDGILRRKSLFITDISVVEDPARTYDPTTGTGNPGGVWTFGNMIMNMAGNSGVTARDFLKSWLKQWMQDVTVNGETVPKRQEILDQLIIPWIISARAYGTGCSTELINNITDVTWESYWDNTNENDLIVKAPFKLTAIVNRVDLRENSAFQPTVQNSGETRFIFTLISKCGPGGYAAGDVPAHLNQDFQNPNPPLFDWVGMNVILEYGNVQTSICDLRDFAEEWKNLSSMPMPSTQFNDALEDLTNTVTAMNAAPGKPNGSAINRIRTNEKLFQRVSSTTSGWRAADWEFRQFEIDPGTGLLEMAPLTNTPVNKANYAQNLWIDAKTYPAYLEHLNGVPAGTYDNYKDALINWVFISPLNKLRILRGNYNMPEKYPTSSDPFLAGGGRVEGEYAHYWDFKWDPNETVKYQTSATNSQEERDIRNQISLNTCQGCHMGETKTIFSQVLPLDIGEEAKYWNNPPEYKTERLDGRGGFGENIGISFGTHPNYDRIPVVSTSYRVKVSAFLTGRSYTGTGAGTYDDDDPNDVNDNLMTDRDLYVVYDPSNGTGYTDPQGGFFEIGPDRRYGYNDLARRKQDMCNLIQTGCGLGVLDVITKMHHIPLAKGGH